MNRFYILFFAAALLATSGIAQEQVLPSTPIYATAIEEAETPQPAVVELPTQEKALARTQSISSYAVGPTPTNAAVSPRGNVSKLLVASITIGY